MRISTSQYFETSAANYTKNFSDTAKTNEQISSGIRIQTAADDPVGAAKLLMLQQQSALLTQYSSNMTTATNALNQQESVLSSIHDAMQRASELAIQAGNGGLSDADRTSIAAEIGEIEGSVFGMLNSKDANGDYLFGGSKSSTPPYVRNADGTYAYQGDQTRLSLQVSDTLKLATSNTGHNVFELAVNNSRTEATLTAPAVDDGRVSVSDGLLNSVNSYSKSFAAGQPYTVNFTSATQYSIVDADGNDVTSETASNGVFDREKEGASTITFRGVDFEISVNLQETDSDPDAAIAGHSFTLQAKPDSVTTTRSAANTSTAQVTASNITDNDKFLGTFPDGGAVIKFSSATDYKVYAQPYNADSKAIAEGVMGSGNTVTAAGVTFTFDGAPNANDQFSVTSSTHKTQNVLDTLSSLRKSLLVPVTDTATATDLKNAVASAISNLGSARERIDLARGEIGAAQNSMQIQQDENTSLSLANKSTQSAIGNTDMSTAAITLTLQQTMLQASQLAFAKISQLSLFNKL
ncbi:flagellar hook-associated protein 3 [Pseudomonas sp. R5(2019)]|uniref:flagellar hook-associated protein 3 n=1 Tax=Pseudomonas sp. R5(2019) TaxID=2697566 RepID=UPI001412875C|nr:flagellar hook-associated protein 3 [Pseudomonas sp. R5(2019)]NBA95754.1 flagellar hook-associated protein 3 [Pseudomonas sp. R5(2019)]